MKEILSLLKDGHSRSVEMLAAELNTTTDDIVRRMDFLEHAGLIRRVLNTGKGCSAGSCSSCSACSAKGNCPGASASCAACYPEGGFKNMGQMWEVVQ